MAIKRLSNKTYRIFVEMGYDCFGNRKRKTEVVHGSKEKTVLRESELKKQYYHVDKKIEINHLTFKEYSEIFLRKYGNSNLSLVTITKYEKLLKIINDKIGHIKLQSITPLVLDNLYCELQYGENGQKLSYNYRYDFYKLINSMFCRAIKWKLVESNPNELVSNKPKKEYKEKRYYDFEQVSDLLSILGSESIKNQAIILLALDSGCRRGEIAGLHWSDINLNDGTINIRRSLKLINGVADEETAKTETSKRTIVISETTKRVLIEYKKWQKEQIKNIGKNYIDPNRVFANNNGRYMNPNSFGKILRKILKRYNLPPLSFHELRHTNTSLLINAGIDPRTVSKRLGHSNTNITMQVYTHTFETSKKECANKFDELCQNKLFL